jgi:hypothetical protein
MLVDSMLHMSKKNWLEGTGPELSILKFAVNPYISLSLGNTNMVGGGGGCALLKITRGGRFRYNFDIPIDIGPRKSPKNYRNTGLKKFGVHPPSWHSFRFIL